jgi:hypothetical protein
MTGSGIIFLVASLAIFSAFIEISPSIALVALFISSSL